MWAQVFLFLVLALHVEADIIAYDCADQDTEITRISLLDVRPCADPRNATEKITKRIQLVQERHFSEVHVNACLVTVQQLVEHCGMHSHTSAVAGGLTKYIHYLKAEACVNAHKHRRLDLSGIGGGIITALTRNGTTEVSATLEGKLEPSGKCQGVKFTVNGITYEDVIVSAAITVKLQDYTALANIEENTINLRTGTVCSFTENYCFDDLSGEVTFEVIRQDQCMSRGIDVLYEGVATVMTLSGEENRPETKYVIVETQDTVFALRLSTRDVLCQQQAWRTEQNRLLVIFETSLGFFYQKSRKIQQNTDLMAQVLTKLLFLEIAVKQQVSDLIYDSILKRCRLREMITRNRLALARESPDIISDLVKEAAGHVGRVLGEVLYIAKCRAKIVDFRRTQFCYQELPITYRNESLFMTPITHIIQDRGTQVDCDGRLPVMFHLEGKWLELLPELKQAHPSPIRLAANDETENIPLMKISPISSHGVYSREDMEAFQHALMFPAERKAVANLMTRRVAGVEVDGQGYHIPNVFSRAEFTTMALNAAEEVWGILSKLGNVFSIIMLVYTCLSFFSYMAGVVVNFFTLKKVANDRPRPRFFWCASLWQALASRYAIHQLRPPTEAPPMNDPTETNSRMSRLYPSVSQDTLSHVVEMSPLLAPPPNLSSAPVAVLRQAM